MTAFGYVERLQAYCVGLGDFPERGRRRDDLRPGLRTIGVERRVLIAFHVMGGLVTIDRVLYGGRDLGVLASDEM
jgi:toxin ParE1/3/4